MKCSRFISAFLLMAITMGMQTTSFAASSAREPQAARGATAFFDYVLHEDSEGDVEDYSAALNDGDTFDFGVLFEEGTTDQKFYMGNENAPFTKIFFQMEAGLSLEGDTEDDIIWEYYNGSTWKTLDVDYGVNGGFGTVSGRSASFDFPENWEKTDVDGNEAYFVRLTLESEPEYDAKIEKLSAMAYTIQVTLKSNNGDKVTGLDERDFSAYDCRDEHVYGVEEVEKGTYWVGVQTTFESQTCHLAVKAKKYYDRSIEVDPSTDAPMVTRVLTYAPEWSKDLREERAQCETPFMDIDTHWSADAVREVYCSGVIDGGRFFMPNQAMTRAEFIHILMTTSEVALSRETEAYFEDVDSRDVYFEAVQTAYEMDVVDRDEYFSPNDTLTRAEAVQMTMNLANHVEDIRTNDTNTRFWDVKSTDWFAGTVKAATNYQIVVGYVDGSFGGNKAVTRAEGVVISNNYWYAFARDARDNRHNN